MTRHPRFPRRSEVVMILSALGKLLPLPCPRSFLRPRQLLPTPSPGAKVVGSVSLGSTLKDQASLEQQKRLILDYIEQHGWQHVGWYEEPEPSAAAEDLSPRLVFSRLLAEAGAALKRWRKMQVWCLDRIIAAGFARYVTSSLLLRKRVVSSSDTCAKERQGGF